jgi:hypothetical protein
VTEKSSDFRTALSATTGIPKEQVKHMETKNFMCSSLCLLKCGRL